jgi:lipid-A-disaccharide synthase
LRPISRLLLSCGEPSGDLYGAELVRALRATRPELAVFGLGGDRLLAEGAQLVAHVRDLAVVGLLEVLSHLRQIRGVFRQLLAEVDRQPPDAAVLVDYPDFNLRLARELHARGIPVIYYVSPQIWAWRGGRIGTIRDTVHRMIVIFPFEEPLYREAGVPVTFVGHPLVDLVRPAADRRSFLATLGLDADRPVVALLPGSRPKEVAHNLPAMAGAVALLRQRRPEVQFAVAVAPSLPREAIEARLQGLAVALVAGQTHCIVGAATAAVVASGTATVETALLGTPMVVVYRLSGLTYALGRPLVRVPHFAMVNLIAGARVVPELIQHEMTPEKVAAEVLALLDEPARAEAMRAALAEVRQRMGPPGASRRAAEVVLEALEKG